MIKYCEWCGVEFEENGSQKYCSCECSDSVCSGTRFSVNSSFLLLDRMLESLTEEDTKTVEDWILRNTNDKTVKLHLRSKVKS